MIIDAIDNKGYWNIYIKGINEVYRNLTGKVFMSTIEYRLMSGVVRSTGNHCVSLTGNPIVEDNFVYTNGVLSMRDIKDPIYSSIESPSGHSIDFIHTVLCLENASVFKNVFKLKLKGSTLSKRWKPSDYKKSKVI